MTREEALSNLDSAGLVAVVKRRFKAKRLFLGVLDHDRMSVWQKVPHTEDYAWFEVSRKTKDFTKAYELALHWACIKGMT